MKRILFALSVAAVALAVGCSGLETDLDPLRWEKLPPLPDALGFGGPYAGVANGALVVAGGANFPVSLFRGGKKVWYDKTFVLPRGSSAWLTVGKLERPLAYGSSATTAKGLMLLGGCDSEKCYDDVTLLSWENYKVVTRKLRKLPKPCAFSCAALVGNTVYVAGGQDSMNPKAAMKNFWALDLTRALPRWEELEPWPGPARIKAVAGSLQGAFYLFSGTELVPGTGGEAKPRYLTDAYRYRPGKGWEKLADLPTAVAAAPQVARQHERRYLMVFGGSDGRYTGPPEKHPGFSHEILGYDVRLNQWVKMGIMPVGPVTTTTALWDGKIVIPSGEVRPGIRTPNVHVARLWRQPFRRTKIKMMES
ncbi:galactose oxidase, partial [bacterium]|nr:galactose oxidase [bacterium]